MTSKPQYLILLCGGEGVRLDAPLPKAFLPVGGIPMYLWSLAGFLNADHFRRVVIVYPRSFPERFPVVWKQQMTILFRFLVQAGRATLPVLWVPGGKTRTASVQAGLEVCSAPEGMCIIHDAARPFVPPQWFREFRSAVDEYLKGDPSVRGGGYPVLPVPDTLLWREKMVPREEFQRVQTPQIFSLRVLRESFVRAGKESIRFPDETTRIRRFLPEIQLYAYPGTPFLHKVTWKPDLEWAERMAMGILAGPSQDPEWGAVRELLLSCKRILPPYPF